MQPGERVYLRDNVGLGLDSIQLARAMSAANAVRLSGVQVKLPVSLSSEGDELAIVLGDLRTPCTHILKFTTPSYHTLVPNEWLTLELARRCGFTVPTAHLVHFKSGSTLPGPALLVERYDIPTQEELDRGGSTLRLVLPRDLSTLLGLRRVQKYDTSIDTIAGALRDAGAAASMGKAWAAGMEAFFTHVYFSWLTCNGDLHAKNFSVLHDYTPSSTGPSLVTAGIRYAPLYDLVNTTLEQSEDRTFALPLNGHRNNVGRREWLTLAKQCGIPATVAKERMEAIAQILSESVAILPSHVLPPEPANRYKLLVNERLAQDHK
jgi:serine/threonine-protein kinase HipA